MAKQHSIVFDGQTYIVNLKFKHMLEIEKALGKSVPKSLTEGVSFQLVAEMTYQVVRFTRPDAEYGNVIDRISGKDFAAYSKTYAEFLQDFLGVDEEEVEQGNVREVPEPPRMQTA